MDGLMYVCMYVYFPAGCSVAWRIKSQRWEDFAEVYDHHVKAEYG